jgi:hypothetical protein
VDGKSKQNTIIFLISKFRRVLNVVFFLLGESPASECYVSTFRNTCLCKLGAECSETSAHKIQTPGFNLKERIQRNSVAYSFTDFHFSWYGFRRRVPIFDVAKPACIPTSRLLVSPNSMVGPRRCQRGDRAFCLVFCMSLFRTGTLYSATLKNMAIFNVPTYGYMLFQGPFSPFYT